MKPETWQQMKTCFHAALELAEEERAAFLTQACDGDDELRGRVEKLLDSHSDVGSFLASPAIMDAGVITAVDEIVRSDHNDRIGQRIGPYEILREIGRGGMGTVFLAVRADDQYRKEVAIKIVNRGMDTDTILRRFVMERQILANLEHPNIARLLDGGTTLDGLPYFVMEYVEGQPITEYCDARRLTTTQRLELFRQVCGALQYAHQNLVVHRDIKPSNILVTGGGVPKLLDFGIAKLLSPGWATETGEATASMVRLMTPEYASPEQFRGLSITTSSDVYGLGILLYELLTGRHPYRLASRRPEEVVQIILHDEAVKPSVVITRAVDTTNAGNVEPSTGTSDSAQTREGTVERLRRRLSGDLDNIVLKALRKEPQRRYASVQEFSEDIRRHLEGLPVMASPDTFSYRTAKFVQRHKVSVLAAAVVLITLLTATLVTARQARVARRERVKAEKRFNDVRRLANSFLFDFERAISDLQGSTPARELVVQKALEYLDSLAQEDTNDPSLRNELANAYIKVGDIQGGPDYSNLGHTAEALENYRKALTLIEELVKADPQNADYKRTLIRNYTSIGDIQAATSNTLLALENYQKAWTIAKEMLTRDPQSTPVQHLLVFSQFKVGDMQARTGDLDESLENYREVSERCKTLVEANSPDSYFFEAMLLSSYDCIANELGNPIFLNRGKTSEALDLLYKERDACMQRISADKTMNYYRLKLAYTFDSLGEVFTGVGDWKAAHENFDKALEIWQQQANADPQDVFPKATMAFTLTELGEVLAQTGQLSEALEHHRQAIDKLTKLVDADPRNDVTRAYLAFSYTKNGDALAKGQKNAAALESYLKAIALYEPIVGQDTADLQQKIALVKPYANIGKSYLALADEEAGDKRIALLREARTFLQRSLDLYQKIQQRYKLPKNQNAEFEEVNRALVRCAAALSES